MLAGDHGAKADLIFGGYQMADRGHVQVLSLAAHSKGGSHVVSIGDGHTLVLQADDDSLVLLGEHVQGERGVQQLLSRANKGLALDDQVLANQRVGDLQVGAVGGAVLALADVQGGQKGQLLVGLVGLVQVDGHLTLVALGCLVFALQRKQRLTMIMQPARSVS